MVTLDVGQTIEVTLETNPSTGFSWALEAWDDHVVTPMGEPDFTPGGEADAVGVGGTVVWRFEAVASGRSAVELAYARPWEDVAPEQTFRFVVEVR